ncbi:MULTISPECIES: hypothetical protein [unclassified Serratia (in: enterobacteria)]|uniref:hypothetical protein n=1 Tax=unclassified Serratia (in: enterobacteria) TaxID=2647522 RepID=UPI00307637A1
MSEINIPHNERDALKAVDTNILDQLIEQCLSEERPDALRCLRLECCGVYVASQLRMYEKTLGEYSKSKTAKKCAETKYSARLAGNDLAHAVQQMKSRVEKEEKEALLFCIEDQIMKPYHFNEHITVRVNYHWRQSTEDKWVYGKITFFHDVDLRPDYLIPLSNRKPSVAKQKLDRQDKLYREWEYLKILGLHSVKEYFRNGGDGALIPQMFQAKIDPFTRRLNNFSAEFWHKLP